jgi:hypothetical protein
VDRASRTVGVGYDQELLVQPDAAHYISVHVDDVEGAVRSNIRVHGGLAAPG